MNEPNGKSPPKKHFLAFSRITLREETFANLAKNSEISHSREFILAKIRDKSFADGCLLPYR